MTKKEFLEIVSRKANIDIADAERITSAVFQTLRSQLSREESVDIMLNLPEDIENIWEGNWLQKLTSLLQSFREMDKDEFIEQIREAADIRTSKEAELVAEVVFNTLKAAIPPREVEHISRDLPDNLKDLWKAA
ncbi:MAG: DUF2267 domain-containing protein [Actinomycetota bacterium]